MTYAIALFLAGTAIILFWWFFIDPIRGCIERIATIENDVRDLELKSVRVDEAIKSHNDDIHRMQDIYGNHLNHLLPRTDRLEEYIFGHSFALRVERENSEPPRDLISLNPHQRANTGH